MSLLLFNLLSGLKKKLLKIQQNHADQYTQALTSNTVTDNTHDGRRFTFNSCWNLRDIIQWGHNGVQDLIRCRAESQTGSLQPVAHLLVGHGLLGSHFIRQLAEGTKHNQSALRLIIVGIFCLCHCLKVWYFLHNCKISNLYHCMFNAADLHYQLCHNYVKITQV